MMQASISLARALHQRDAGPVRGLCIIAKSLIEHG
jgi:hypothetical protein